MNKHLYLCHPLVLSSPMELHFLNTFKKCNSISVTQEMRKNFKCLQCLCKDLSNELLHTEVMLVYTSRVDTLRVFHFATSSHVPVV